jgi:Asp-tRNA(Asn)/Glu-tRNA(Gln) amidotransferase C subunit
MVRILSSSSSETSEESVRSVETEASRVKSALLQLEDALVDERRETTVAAETRLDVREERECESWDERAGLGGSGMVGGGPRGVFRPEGAEAEANASLVEARGLRWRDETLVRALEPRRKGRAARAVRVSCWMG